MRSGLGIAAFTPGEQIGVADLYEMQPKIGVPFTYTALLTMPTGSHKADARAEPAGLGRRRAGVAAGLAASAAVLDVAGGTLHAQRQPEVRRADVVRARQSGARRMPMPAWRQDTLEAWETGSQFARPRWNTYVFAESAAHPELAGRRLLRGRRGAWGGAVRRAAGHRAGRARPEPAGRLHPRQRRSSTRSARVLTAAGCTLGLSDAGAHVGQLCDAPQATDYLGNWVRDRSLTSLEDAVRRLTVAPGRHPRAGRPRPAGAGRVGRRRRLRSRDRRPGPGAPRRRLPRPAPSG